MSFEPRDYLQHILVEVEYLLAARVDLTFEDFDSDETLRRAFVRSLEVIGEATKKIPDGFRAEHPEVEWRAAVLRAWPVGLDMARSARPRHSPPPSSKWKSRTSQTGR